MEKDLIFETSILWKGEKRGTIRAGKSPELEIDAPAEFTGGISKLWTPEHLFVASANICLMTTFMTITGMSKLEIQDYSSHAKGTLSKEDGKFIFTGIDIFPKISVRSEREKERAERLIYKAEEHCLISNSMKNPTRIFPEFVIIP